MAGGLTVLLPAALTLSVVLSVPVLACDLLQQHQCRVFAAAFKKNGLEARKAWKNEDNRQQSSASFFLRLLFASDTGGRGLYVCALLCRWLICLLLCFPPVLLLLALSGDPAAALLLSAVPFAVFFIISLIKFKVLHEPLVFSDLMLLREVMSCPRFYLGYVTRRQWLGVAVLCCAAVGLWLVWAWQGGEPATEAVEAVQERAAASSFSFGSSSAWWREAWFVSGYEPSGRAFLVAALCIFLPLLTAAVLIKASQHLRAGLTYCSSVLFEPDACRGAAGAGALIYFLQGLLLFWLQAIWPTVIAKHNARQGRAGTSESSQVAADDKTGPNAPGRATLCTAGTAKDNQDLHLPGSIVLLQAESLIDLHTIDTVGEELNFAAAADLRADLELYYFGAYTMRTEFSVLTGIEPKRLGAYAYDPYQLAGRIPIVSLASLLRQAGFYCICMHANSGRFFNRCVVMQNLGFDETIFAEDLPLLNTAGFKDTAVYQIACRRLQQAAALGQKLFVFIISLDGHGPYTSTANTSKDSNSNPRSESEIEVYRNKQRSLEQGVNMLREHMSASDSLFLYGDHLPPIASLLKHGRTYRAAAEVPKPAVYAFNPFVDKNTAAADHSPVRHLTCTQLHQLLLRRGGIDA